MRGSRNDAVGFCSFHVDFHPTFNQGGISSHIQRGYNCSIDALRALTSVSSDLKLHLGKDLLTLRERPNGVPVYAHNLLKQRDKIALLSEIQTLTIPSLNAGQIMLKPSL